MKLSSHFHTCVMPYIHISHSEEKLKRKRDSLKEGMREEGREEDLYKITTVVL